MTSKPTKPWPRNTVSVVNDLFADGEPFMEMASEAARQYCFGYYWALCEADARAVKSHSDPDYWDLRTTIKPYGWDTPEFEMGFFDGKASFDS
jgi:hypothetical protein